MAYPRACGDNPLKYEEYDPTPFSGGYDQVALYGRAKSPSAETCYPITESSHHAGGHRYGAETTPYLGKPSGPKYGVDEDRPSFQHEDPPHGSHDFSSSGYGSGYGKPKPSSYGEEVEGYGSGGYGRHKPSSYEAEGEGFGGSGYGWPKPAHGECGQELGAGYGEGGEQYGRARPKPGHGEGGFSRPHGDEGYGERPPHEDNSFGFGGRKPSRFESDEGGYRPPPPRYGGEEGGFGGGRRPGGFQSDEFGSGEEGYGGRKKHSDYDGDSGDRPSYFGGEPPAPPADEGYQAEENRHGHHHKHHWRHHDDE